MSKIISKKNSTIFFTDNLRKLRAILKKYSIDYFILPNSDEFFNEYLPEHEKKIQFLTGFSGSNAIVIIGQKQCQFFTDGRYILQAKNQLDLKDYEINDLVDYSFYEWLEDNLSKNQTLAINSKNFNLSQVKKIAAIASNKKAKLSIVEKDFFDQLWLNRLSKPESPIYFHVLKYSGKDSIEKRKEITANLKEDAILFTSPESIAWLLNIRASDVKYSPFLLSYAILYKNNSVELFCDPKRVKKMDLKKFSLVRFLENDDFEIRIKSLKTKIRTIQIDANLANYWINNLLKSHGFNLVYKADPCILLKAIKNPTEIKGAIKAHLLDGMAVTKFLFWLEASIKKSTIIDELKAEEKLLEFRGLNKEFLYPSFASISAFADNAAIIHYQASKQTNKKISGDSLYLIDSGGQYFCGTTDITRTVAIGRPTLEMKNDFTRVLKGHIAIATAKFPTGTNGAQLDSLARFSLWQDLKDYNHGTGHGVGSFLSVHEGPVSITKRNQTEPLMPGMILSNEPGYYKDWKYGIRIENLVLVKENMKASPDGRKFLFFKNLSLAPIDWRLVNFKMLSNQEKKYLFNYHREIYKQLAPRLTKSEQIWLRSIINKYKGYYDRTRNYC